MVSNLNTSAQGYTQQIASSMVSSKPFLVCIFFLILAISIGVYFILYNFAKIQCESSNVSDDSLSGDASDGSSGCSIQVYAMLALVCSCPAFMFAVIMIINHDEKYLYRDLIKHVPAHAAEKKSLLISTSIQD